MIRVEVNRAWDRLGGPVVARDSGMITMVSTRGRVWLGVAIFAVAVAVYYPFSPAGRQATNMRRAERHIVTLRPQIRADPRFAAIRLDSFTGRGGSLGVFGTVAHEADAEALRSLFEQSGPPGEIAYRFIVVAPATRPATRLPRG